MRPSRRYEARRLQACVAAAGAAFGCIEDQPESPPPRFATRFAAIGVMILSISFGYFLIH